MSKTAANSFHEYFDIVPATTDALKQAAYRLRYQIYCKEMRAWDLSDFPDGMERDEFDGISDHYLVLHKKTGVYAAHTRLILPDPADPRRPFPVEIHARIPPHNPLAGVAREKIAEASRFCVCNAFKRRQDEYKLVAGIGNILERHLFDQEQERRAYPHIMIALLNCLLRMSVARGITHWYAFMEPSLIRLLGILGLNFIIIGPPAEHHGLRYPCCIGIADLLAGAQKKSSEIFEFLAEGLGLENGL